MTDAVTGLLIGVALSPVVYLIGLYLQAVAEHGPTALPRFLRPLTSVFEWIANRIRPALPTQRRPHTAEGNDHG